MYEYLLLLVSRVRSFPANLVIIYLSYFLNFFHFQISLVHSVHSQLKSIHAHRNLMKDTRDNSIPLVEIPALNSFSIPESEEVLCPFIWISETWKNNQNYGYYFKVDAGGSSQLGSVDNGILFMTAPIIIFLLRG